MKDSERYVIDEKGVKHKHCHGVPAKQWFDHVFLARKKLSKPEERAALGLDRIIEYEFCDDPDCQRLNRRTQQTSAVFFFTRDVAPIHPTNPTSEKERQICEGHPWTVGKKLCLNCAVVATAKRLIDEPKRA